MNGRRLRFAVLGDTHFVSPARFAESRAQALPPRAWDAHAYYTAVGETVWPEVARAIRAAAPDMAVQVGDLVEGGATDPVVAAGDLAYALARLDELGCPVLIAQGNHDRSPASFAPTMWQQVVLPWVARGFGWPHPPEHEYYAAGLAGCRFLLLGSTLQPGDAQHAWLQAELPRPESGQRCFVFGHYPVVPLARPGFAPRAYATSVGPLLASAGVDAYFTAHTHNQCVSLHQFPAGPLLQVKGTPVGVSPAVAHRFGYGAIDLASVRALFPGPYPFRYCWGYLEDTMPGWYLVDVWPEQVTLTFHAAGAGPSGRLSWIRRGTIAEVAPPPPLPAPRLELGDLDHVRAGRLRLAGYGSRLPGKTVWLNGLVAGELPPFSSFATGASVELSAESLQRLGRENEVAIQTAAGESVLFGAILLEVDLDDGRRVRTSVSPSLWTALPEVPAAGERANARDEPFAWVTPPFGPSWFGERLVYLRPGEVAGNIRLAFP